MKETWKSYWERRPREGSDYGWLGHGKVVRLLGKAAVWHSSRFIRALSPRRDWRLLDAGCGAGDEILKYSSRVGWIVGVDFSLGMLHVSRKRLASCGLTNASLVAADVRHLPFKRSAFNGSICMGVLLFTDDEDTEVALAELSRVTSERVMIHGKNSFSPFGAELRLAEMVLTRVREREPYDHHRPFWWYRKRLSRHGRIQSAFSIGLWIPQIPGRAKSLIGSIEVLASSLGLSHPFGKEYYVSAMKKIRTKENDCR